MRPFYARLRMRRSPGLSRRQVVLPHRDRGRRLVPAYSARLATPRTHTGVGAALRRVLTDQAIRNQSLWPANTGSGRAAGLTAHTGIFRLVTSGRGDHRDLRLWVNGGARPVVARECCTTCATSNRAIRRSLRCWIEMHAPRAYIQVMLQTRDVEYRARCGAGSGRSADLRAALYCSASLFLSGWALLRPPHSLARCATSVGPPILNHAVLSVATIPRLVDRVSLTRSVRTSAQPR